MKMTSDNVNADDVSRGVGDETETPKRDDVDALHIVYLHLDEDAAGFRWQVRGHDLPEPLAAGVVLFASIHKARDAGLAALETVCRQFGHQVYVRGA